MLRVEEFRGLGFSGSVFLRKAYGTLKVQHALNPKSDLLGD